MVEKIRMNVNETLELDYLIEQISGGPVSIDEEPTSGSSSLDYIATEKSVFNPTETGIHKLSVNGQTLKIDVFDIPDSVVNQWPTDEGSGNTLADNQGSADGTINGAMWQSLADAVGGYYLGYDGADDLVNLGQDPIQYIYDGDFTITAFIRVDDLSGFRPVVAHRDDGPNDGGELRIDTDGTVTWTWHGNDNLTTSLTVSSGVWAFVSARWDDANSEMTIGVDGAYGTANGTKSTASGVDAYIGASPTTGNYFEGGIDEVTGSNSYLSDSELQTLRDRRSDV